jgi:hypothetical protein
VEQDGAETFAEARLLFPRESEAKVKAGENAQGHCRHGDEGKHRGKGGGDRVNGVGKTRQDHRAVHEKKVVNAGTEKQTAKQKRKVP